MSPHMTSVRAQLIAALLAVSGVASAAAECDSPDRSAGRLVADLGHLKVHDDANNTDYSFAICETYNVFEKTGRLTVAGSPVTSTYIDAADAGKLLQSATSECVTRGAPYSPGGAEDKRMIEYRFCQKDGKASRMEVVVRTLNKNGSPKPIQTLAVPFPDLTVQPAKFLPLPAGSKSDKTIGCDDGEKKLGQVDAQDDANLTHYRFVACLNKDGDVAVRSNFLTGTKWPAKAVADQSKADGCINGGAPYGQQGPGDQRSVTYRLCGHPGSPATVEVLVDTLDAQWKKKAPTQTLSAAVK
jgi:hypothetical protein